MGWTWVDPSHGSPWPLSPHWLPLCCQHLGTTPGMDLLLATPPRSGPGCSSGLATTSTLPRSCHCWGQDWQGPCVSWHPVGRSAFFRHFPPDRNGVKVVLGETASPVPGERALRALRRLLRVPAAVCAEENLFQTSLWGCWCTPWWPPHTLRGYTGQTPAHSTHLRGRRVVKEPQRRQNFHSSAARSNAVLLHLPEV